MGLTLHPLDMRCGLTSLYAGEFWRKPLCVVIKFKIQYVLTVWDRLILAGGNKGRVYDKWPRCGPSHTSLTT